jgi:hypothetical protein
MSAAQDHPPAWSPLPPPPPTARRGAGLVAACIALLLVFGSIGLVSARRSGSNRSGASSPESAVTGLLAALDHDPIDAATLTRASRWLTGEERLLVATDADRFLKLANGPNGLPGGGLDQFALGADGLSFRRVGGATGVAVLEAVSGTVTVRAGGTGRIQLSLDEARRRLAQQTNGAVSSIRAVTVRSGGRWYVSLLATALEYAPLARSDVGGASSPHTPQGQERSAPEYAELARPATPGASSPLEAVRSLFAAVSDPAGEPADSLVPEERNALRAYVLKRGLSSTAEIQRLVRRDGFDLGSARVAGSVETIAPGIAGVPLAGAGPDSTVVVIERGGTWYASMVFTVTDLLLTSVEREHS